MITVPGGKKIYADSTGRPLFVGNRVKFRGMYYTIKEFGLVKSGLATLIFKEKCYTDEVPDECNVDRV